MRRILLALAACLIAGSAYAADNLLVTEGGGGKSIRYKDLGGSIYLPYFALADNAGAVAVYAQGSTTAGQSGIAILCRTLTAAPTDTTAQSNIPSCTTAGELRVNISSGLNANTTPADALANTAGAPVTGFNQVWNGATWDRMPGTAAGGVKTNIGQINGVTVLTGTGATGTGAQRVTVSTDQATNAGAALVKGGVGVVNGGSTYQAVAASQTATVLQTSTGATGDYLSHCVIYPTSTSPGVVTVFDNTNAAAGSAILFPGGATSLSNLAPIAVPVGAVSTAGAWKVTTGASVSVVCYGKFS